MISKEKLVKLTRYLDVLNNKKSAAIPSKHKDRPVEYHKFLDNEIRLVKATIERAKQ